MTAKRRGWQAMTAIERGRRVASALQFSPSNGSHRCDEDLVNLSQTLQDGGLSGFLWTRLSPQTRTTPIGRELKRGALADAASGMRLDARLVDVVRELHAAGVDPVVTKGWAVARYYTNPAARPYSDLDLAVPPDQADAARHTLNKLGARASAVDLHVGLPDLPQRTWSEAFAKTRTESLDGVPIRVLSPECQFRLLTVHLVRHVCCRPLWLIDLAMIIERVGSHMDWDDCLRGSYCWRRWILAIAGLAHRLLGVPLPDGIRSRPGIRPPGWLVEMTCWRWGGGDELMIRGGNRAANELWPIISYRLLNPIRWAYRFGLPPIDFLPTFWIAAMLGKGIQPFPKLWRKHIRRQVNRDTFVMHSRRIF